ncbi:hypothetical protein Tco_0212360 [Tanacetum coccineum]
MFYDDGRLEREEADSEMVFNLYPWSQQSHHQEFVHNHNTTNQKYTYQKPERESPAILHQLESWSAAKRDIPLLVPLLSKKNSNTPDVEFPNRTSIWYYPVESDDEEEL